MEVIEFRHRQLSQMYRHAQTQALGNEARTWLKHRELGLLIRQMRHRRGLNLQDFALSGVYLDHGSLARIERGDRAVDYETICRIADVLHAPEIECYAAQLILSTLRPRHPEAA